MSMVEKGLLCTNLEEVRLHKPNEKSTRKSRFPLELFQKVNNEHITLRNAGIYNFY